jgi:hypothetical protein
MPIEIRNATVEDVDGVRDVQYRTIGSDDS